MRLKSTILITAGLMTASLTLDAAVAQARPSEWASAPAVGAPTDAPSETAPAGTAAGQASSNQCASYERVKTALGSKFQETPVAGGLTLDGRLLQIYATNDGTTWTIVLSKPGGISCATLAGEGWRAMPQPDDNTNRGAPEV